jgi:hypothetical protein
MPCSRENRVSPSAKPANGSGRSDRMATERVDQATGSTWH